MANRTEIDVPETTIALEVGGLPIASKPFSVPGGGSTAVAFDAFTLTSSNTQATVRLAGDALEADNEYLQAGDVFPADLIETWVDYKRTNEVDPIRLRPHPHEFEMYYDI